jgi:Zn-dependent M28 family amino/carboxypeptidase
VKRLPITILLVIAAITAWYFTRGPEQPEIGTRVPFQALPAGLAEQFSGEKAYAHVKSIVDFGPRPPGSDGYEKSLVYLEAAFAQIGWTTRRQSFPQGTPRGPVTFTNLLARHTAGQSDWSRSTPVIIGGHLDSKLIEAFPFVGANDGGSSTGVILELARVLSTSPTEAAKVELILFDGEEAFLENITPTDGLYGSKYYAHAMSKRATWPSLGIVIDLIGDSRYGYYYNPEAPPSFAATIEKVAAETGMKLARPPGPIIDDHVPLQNTGLPCLHLIGDFMNMPYWHQPGDTMEVIDVKALDQTGRTTLKFLAEVKP